VFRAASGRQNAFGTPNPTQKIAKQYGFILGVTKRRDSENPV